jgi:DNA polymerase III epsilon subunit family exonuclease
MDVKTRCFVAIDLETTGLKSTKDEIISFACVPIIHRRIMAGRMFYTLIKPRTYFYNAMKYHGISNNDLQEAPTFGEISDNLLTRLDGILVGHTIGFDYSFLQSNFKKSGVKFKKECLDIVMVERWLRKQHKTAKEGDLTLDGMIAAYGLKPHYRHNAAADAFFAAQIFQMQLRKLLSLGIDSPKKMMRAAKSCRYPVDDYLFYG